MSIIAPSNIIVIKCSDQVAILFSVAIDLILMVLMALHGPPVLAVLFLLLAVNQLEDEAFVMPYVEDSAVVVDGSLEPDEYIAAYSDAGTGIDVYWEHNGSHIKIGLDSPGSGWISIGFGPRGIGMDGANIVLGYVDEEGLVILDEVGIGRNHFPDGERGGRDDISDASGSMEGERTILEFVFPLSSGDQLDHSFKSNKTYGFFLGYHATAKDSSAYHTARSEVIELFIEPAPDAADGSANREATAYHYAVASVVILIVAGVATWYIRRPKVIRFEAADGWPQE